jgi:hypothetical protein
MRSIIPKNSKPEMVVRRWFCLWEVISVLGADSGRITGNQEVTVRPSD